MSHFHKQGNIFTVVSEEAMDIRPKLPAGTYIVGLTPAGFILEHTLDYDIKFKLYGDLSQKAERILATYKDRPHSTGVLLSGEKGSGKTLLAKLIAQEAAKQDIPTLIVTRPFHGDGFNGLMQNINQPCIVVFDEFEKVYDNEQQQAILTLMDGLVVTRKLFILTVNDHWKVNDHMKNRPGRLFYRLDFDGLSEEFVRGYCGDNLKNKTHIEALCKSLVLFDKFNFDMLKALVEEMNRWDETPTEAMKFLNIRPDVKKDVYEIKTFIHGIECHNNQGRWHGNPFTDSVYLYVSSPEKSARSKKIKELKAQGMDTVTIAASLGVPSDDPKIRVDLSPDQMTSMDARNGIFVYEFKDRFLRVTIQKEPPKSVDYYRWID